MDELLMLLQAKLDEVKSKGNINSNIKRIQSQIDKLKIQAEIDPKSISNIIKQIQKIANQKINISNINIDIGNAQKAGQQIGQTIANTAKKEIDKLSIQVNKIQFQLDDGTYDAKVNTLIAKTQQWTGANGQARISTEQLSQALKSLSEASAAYSKNGTVENQQKLIAAEKELDAQIKATTNSVRSMQVEFAKDSSVRALNRQVTEFYQKNSAAHGQWGKQLQSIMSATANGISVPNAELEKMKRQFYEIQGAARTAGKLGLSFGDSIQKQVSKFTQWVSVSTLIMKGFREIKNAAGNVKELDDALTNISYTMDVTDSQLKKIGNSSLQTAKDLSTTASNVLDAVKTYANANETAQSIIEKAKPTIMMSNVSGMGTDQTVDILQGAVEQFDLEDTADQLMHISDVFQTVSTNMPMDFAKGLKELSEGLQVSGSVAKDASYDIESYTALLGTLISKTRQGGSEIGRSLRTMMLRTTKASTSALANGEVTEDDLSNAEKALRRVGIEVRSDADTFKDFDQIIGELYNKLDTLSDVDMSNLAYELAGIRQANVFKLMISGYAEFQNMAEKAQNAEGTTLQNQEKYANSLIGKLNELSAIWEKIGDDTLSSRFLKGLTDAGIFVSTLIEKFGLLNTAMVGGGIVAFVKNFD